MGQRKNAVVGDDRTGHRLTTLPLDIVHEVSQHSAALALYCAFISLPSDTLSLAAGRSPASGKNEQVPAKASDEQGKAYRPRACNLSILTSAEDSLLNLQSSSPIWKATRDNSGGTPDCPSDLSEPQYAMLLFVNECTVSKHAVCRV